MPVWTRSFFAFAAGGFVILAVLSGAAAAQDVSGQVTEGGGGFRVASAEAQSLASINNCLFQNDLFARLADPLPATDCSSLAFSDTDAQTKAV